MLPIWALVLAGATVVALYASTTVFLLLKLWRARFWLSLIEIGVNDPKLTAHHALKDGDLVVAWWNMPTTPPLRKEMH